MNRNLISKISIMLMVILLVSLGGTACMAASVGTPPIEEVQEEKYEPRLNTKVYFEGTTYLFHTGNTPRKQYTKENPGCGIVSIIVPGKAHGVYISGEGWVSADQIIKSSEYITIKFNKTENGLNSTLTIDGEFVNVQSGNEGIIKYNNGVLEATGKGSTTVTFITPDNREIEAVVTTFEGGMELNIPEKSVTVNGAENVDLLDKKINIKAEEGATLGLKIEDGIIEAVAGGNANVTATVEDKEIVNAGVKGDASASVSGDGAKAEASAEQSVSLFQKAIIKFKEYANAFANREEVGAGAGVNGSVNGNEVVSEDVSVSHKNGVEEADGNVKIDIANNEVINKGFKIPGISSFKRFIETLK